MGRDTGESGGNPPAMIKMQDGRICLVYGYRATPFGIRARLSEDGGHTWGDVIHLRGRRQRKQEQQKQMLHVLVLMVKGGVKSFPLCRAHTARPAYRGQISYRGEADVEKSVR